jgi:uncharacterized membrane protein YfcA
LFVAVLIAGYAGSYLGARRYESRTIEKLLGIIILVAIILLARKLLF